MTALIAILILLFTPAAMLITNLLRRKKNILWLLAISGALTALVLVYITRRDIPQEFTPLTWQPQALFGESPGLLVDSTSWIFAMALVIQVLAIMLTRTAQMSWRAWAANLALTSFGLVAALSGNILTLLFAWAVLDIAGLLVFFSQATAGTSRNDVVSAFYPRFVGIAMLLLAGIVIWNQGGEMEFRSISPQASVILLLAAGFRLGFFPIHVPDLNELPTNIGLGTVVRQVPVAASLVLLVRGAQIGIHGITGQVLLGLTALTGLIGGFGWLRASDENSGRPYWILATTSLAAAAMILTQPAASLAWSLAALLPGSLIFIAAQRHRTLAPILLLGALCLTGLPYTPLWVGTSLFIPTTNPGNLFAQTTGVLTSLGYFVIHALLLAGYLIHGLRGVFTPKEEPQQPADRWVWLLSIPGLVSLPVVHILLGWLIWPDPAQTSLVMWIEGAAAMGLAAAIWYFTTRPSRSVTNARVLPAIRRGPSVEEIYRSIYQTFGWLMRVISRTIRMISQLLEGEAGILWALVLLVLVLVYLQQS